jgi:hypothetical protein
VQIKTIYGPGGQVHDDLRYYNDPERGLDNILIALTPSVDSGEISWFSVAETWVKIMLLHPFKQ